MLYASDCKSGRLDIDLQTFGAIIQSSTTSLSWMYKRKDQHPKDRLRCPPWKAFNFSNAFPFSSPAFPITVLNVAIILMVIATTFIGPPLLRLVFDSPSSSTVEETNVERI